MLLSVVRYEILQILTMVILWKKESKDKIEKENEVCDEWLKSQLLFFEMFRTDSIAALN